MGRLKNEGELLEWLQKVDILFRLSEIEAKIVLGYLEGSGYSLLTQGRELFLSDDINEVRQDITIDYVMDQACETNYELIEETVEKIASSDMEIDTTEQEQYLLGLIQDEKVLDSIFKRTRYQKEIDEKVRLLSAGKGRESTGMRR